MKRAQGAASTALFFSSSVQWEDLHSLFSSFIRETDDQIHTAARLPLSPKMDEIVVLTGLSRGQRLHVCQNALPCVCDQPCR